MNVEEFLLLTDRRTLMDGLQRMDYTNICLTLKPEARRIMAEHLTMMHRNIALQLRDAQPK